MVGMGTLAAKCMNWAAALGMRQRLIILVLLTVAPLVLLLVWTLYNERQAALAGTSALLRQEARLAAEHQASTLNEAVAVLQDLRTIPAITVEGGDACREQVTRFHDQHPVFASIGVLRLDGVVVCHNLLQGPKAVGHDKLLAQALRADAPEIFVSHYLHGPVTGQPVIFVASPLRNSSGLKVGVVYVSIDLTSFSTVTGELTPDKDRIVAVIEPETGIVLARSAGSGLEVGKAFPDRRLANAMLASPSGGAAEGIVGGKEHVFGFAPLPGAETSGAMVAFGEPTSLAVSAVNKALIYDALLVLATIALAVGSAWTLAYFTQVRPTEYLAAVARSIGEGNLLARVRLPSWQAPELRKLGEAVNQMASELQSAEATLRASERRYRMLADKTADLVTHIDGSGKRVYVSPASKDLWGYEPEELLGKSPLEVAHPADRGALEKMLQLLQEGQPAPAVQYRARRPDGSYMWVETFGRPLGVGKGAMLSVRDVSVRKSVEDELSEANEKLMRMAMTDALTGLENRRSFDVAFAKEFARCLRDQTPIALLLVDVDYFKKFNDSYGHQAGDECLKSIGGLLKEFARRPGDTAARYGGEEFALILPNTSYLGARQAAERLRRAVQDLGILHGESPYGRVTVSVGVAGEVPKWGTEERILLLADAALYEAKAAGRNRIGDQISVTAGSKLARAGGN
jgi:diguanylate cyclase (GGDEF)-like protein/PAS domain S-box-containing protein